MNPTIQATLDELVPLEQRVVDAPVEPFGFGTDLSCSSDLTEAMDEVDPFSVEALAEAVIRRLTTERGSLPDDPDYGRDIRAYLNRGTTTAELVAMASEIRAELERDDRIDGLVVVVTPAPDGAALAIRLAITPVDPRVGGFSLTLAVTSAAVVLEEMARS